MEETQRLTITLSANEAKLWKEFFKENSHLKVNETAKYMILQNFKFWQDGLITYKPNAPSKLLEA